jgi:ATP-dependent DNA ligase
VDERVDPAFTPTNGGRSCRRTPIGTGWQYEPKYDGFRCLAHRRCGRVHLQSKNQKPLERYFSEVAEEIEEIAADDFVFDGGSSFRWLLREPPAAPASRCSMGR